MLRLKRSAVRTNLWIFAAALALGGCGSCEDSHPSSGPSSANAPATPQSSSSGFEPQVLQPDSIHPKQRTGLMATPLRFPQMADAQATAPVPSAN